MKIFDRYIVGSFLRNYVLSFIVLVGLYVALDMVFNFDELTKTQSTMGPEAVESGISSALALTYNIADFYFYQTFAFFVQLSGIIPVVAACFTLARMMRFNELTAMLAAGVPIHRLAVPVLLAGVGMSVLLVVDQELIIPNITHKLSRRHAEINSGRVRSFPIRALEDEKGSLLIAARYMPPWYDASGRLLPPSMEELDIIEFNAEREPIAHAQATSAVYDEKTRSWRLTNGIRQTGLRPDDKPLTTRVSEWKTDLGPDEIALYNRSSYVDLLSTSQINSLLQHPRNYGTVPLLRVKHARLVQPIMNVVLLLLATACMLTREPNAIKQTAMRAFMFTAAGLGTMFISHQLAGNPPSPGMVWIWPALMLWFPVFIFAPIAVWMLDQVKS